MRQVKLVPQDTKDYLKEQAKKNKRLKRVKPGKEVLKFRKKFLNFNNMLNPVSAFRNMN